MTTLVLSALVQVAVLGSADEQYMAAYDRSARSGRPLLVLLGADWCPGCRVMKNRVLPQLSRTGGLRDVEFVYVDFDRQRELAKQLSRSKTIPQLIWFVRTPDGWRSAMLNGAQSPEEVQSFIDAGVARTASHARPTATLSHYSEPVQGDGR